MNRISLVKKFVLLTSVVFFASCDKEFNTIGSDIVGDDYFQFEKDEFNELTAEDSITGPVQTNNLTLNSLGTYSHPVYGVGAAHFVTQVELPNSTPVVIGENPVIDSVWVYVPSFSTQTGTDTDGTRTYTLDSIVGDRKSFRLKVYQNGYHLTDYNPDNENGTQRHFSNDKSKIESNLRGAVSNTDGTSVPNGQPLNNGPSGENTNFTFNSSEKIIYKTNGNGVYVDAAGVALADQGDVTKYVIKERFTPGLWLNLNKKFIEDNILKAPAAKLANNNAFKEYFRGLYFQVEAINPTEGDLARFNFSKGFIRICYKVNGSGSTPRVNKTLSLKLSGNTINFFDTNYTLPGNHLTDNRLHLKGGNGTIAFVNVFGTEDANANNIPDKLEELRANNWMINEANLTFYIDKDAMSVPSPVAADRTYEPDRIYLYDAKNKKPILDYYADGSTNGSKPKYNKKGFGGIIEKGADKKGVKYKIRITEYLKNCIKNADSTNYRLGVVVSENINNITNTYLLPAAPNQAPRRVVPLSSALSPLGTVLYGPGLPSSDMNYDKRLKLEIYYTKPD